MLNKTGRFASCPFVFGYLILNCKQKMKKMKTDFAKVVSFRITEAEKKELEKLIEPMQITKSAFFRHRFKQILLTHKK
jgi:hypothetical protein